MFYCFGIPPAAADPGRPVIIANPRRNVKAYPASKAGRTFPSFWKLFFLSEEHLATGKEILYTIYI